MSPVTIALAGFVAMLVLLPTRRLYLAGWRRDALAAYFGVVWALGIVVAVVPVPARFLLPVVLIAYLAPFVTLREGIDRLFGRPPRSGNIGGGASGGASGGRNSANARPIKDVTPPGDR
ncbi:MAG: hypothetical protein ABIV26_03175 [Candidatus Limnocylindrales bacterium]